jgi:hypothetical protein
MNLLSTPQTLERATASLDARTPIASVLRTAQWAEVPAQLRRRAFFSAGVDWSRFLDQGKSKLLDALSMRKEQVKNGEAYVDRSSWIGDMRKLVIAEGKGEGSDPNDLTDLASRARLKLIFDTQTRQAFGFSSWKRDQDPELLNVAPAQELLPSTARQPRQDWESRWESAGGRLVEGRMVALKTDPVWTGISRFGVPWPPFDFGSRRLLEDVSRAEAERLGLIDADTVLDPAQAAFTDSAEAQLSDFNPDTREALLSLLGDQVEIDGNIVRWRKAA